MHKKATHTNSVKRTNEWQIFKCLVSLALSSYTYMKMIQDTKQTRNTTTSSVFFFFFSLLFSNHSKSNEEEWGEYAEDEKKVSRKWQNEENTCARRSNKATARNCHKLIQDPYIHANRNAFIELDYDNDDDDSSRVIYGYRIKYMSDWYVGFGTQYVDCEHILRFHSNDICCKTFLLLLLKLKRWMQM